MPWEHCGRVLADNLACTECGLAKARWEVVSAETRLFALGKPPWPGDALGQAAALKAAHTQGAAFCET